ncbi:hypothetical protein E8D34_09120 [Nocardioides sp. GY 10113]|uniref:hypothetical protein n=1 Tax=Nocardioides sp. GY 10113 TaxID=2569761 RepID=UPI0010A9184B|nr:hypothetical protein [Nocardioides sp. GY 10113]TIC87812.1 hypothetical protein E8D34_09120 [Nocardioides sp. GY 10113]
MTPWLFGAVLVLCGVAAIAVVVHLVRDEIPSDRTFILLGLVELALLIQLVVGIVALATTDRDVTGVLFVSYLIGVAAAPPIGAFWSLAERSRGGTAVLLLAMLTVAALEVRLWDIWGGAGA